MDAGLRPPRRPHADTRLRGDARGCDDGVRQELAARLLRFNDLAICPCRRYLNGRHSGHGTLTAKEVFYDTPHPCSARAGDIHSSVVRPGHHLHTDRSGYTTGIDGNRTVNTYTDRYGNTTGWIGGKYISTYSDGYGGTTGTIGNKRINTYGDGYGYTRGTIGRDQVNTYTDRSGFTTGTIGRGRVNCFTDRLRTTKCY